ncbi:MAG TPA: hypothetical protein VEI03_03645 [Stellaceae bacterium]|nr:hypothetical protein [Stellaceae bacterium]
MRGGLLIDESGRLWPEESRELMRRLDYRGSSRAFILHAIDLGCIHLKPNESGIRVALSAGAFGRRALAAALYALAARAPRQILLAALASGAWSYRIFASIADFGAHAEDLAAGRPGATQRFLAIEKPEPALAAWPTFRKALPVVRLWRKNRGELSEDLAPTLMSAGLFDRSLLARGAGAQLVWEHFGAGFTGVYQPCESLLQVGRDVHEFCDAAYGAWTAESYARTFAGSRLRLDTCDATFQTPRASYIRARYDRILMPWTYRSQKSVVLAISIRRAMASIA